MKMPQAVYEELRDDIRTAVAVLRLDLTAQDHGHTGLKAMYALEALVERNRSYNDDHPAFRDNVWTRILPFTGRKSSYLYDLGLNDDHIATALRKIKAELLANPPAFPQAGGQLPAAPLVAVQVAPEVKAPVLQPIATAPLDSYILLFAPSGYTSTPWRAEVGCWSEDRRAWVNHAHDRFTDGGEAPTHWTPLPTGGP